MRIETIGNATLHQGDCLALMEQLPDASVDMILCDLPYGTTACKWDTVIPFEPLWAQYRRIAKKNAAIVLTASQPFTSALVMSNPGMFKYEWIWEKSKASNFVKAKSMALKAHESVLVFGLGKLPYFPQMTVGEPFKGAGRSLKGSESAILPNVPNPTFRHDNAGTRYPRSVQYFATAESEKNWRTASYPKARRPDGVPDPHVHRERRCSDGQLHGFGDNRGRLRQYWPQVYWY